jgi:hypothetical protein
MRQRLRANICCVAAPRRWHRIACVAAPICPPRSRKCEFISAQAPELILLKLLMEWGSGQYET